MCGILNQVKTMEQIILRLALVATALFFFGLLAASGCSSPTSVTHTRSPQGELPEVKFSQERYRVFFQSFLSNCQNEFLQDQHYMRENPYLTPKKIEGYCNCFAEELKVRYSEADLDKFINSDQDLDDTLTDDIASVCSAYLEK